MGKQTQLELKHLAAYLPYGFTCLIDQQIVFIAGAYNLNNKLNVVSDAGNDFDTSIWAVKPILRPLSDLMGTTIINQQHGVSFMIDLENNQLEIEAMYGTQLMNIINDVELLYENHFDLFGLIDAGLAVDINTIPPC